VSLVEINVIPTANITAIMTIRGISSLRLNLLLLANEFYLSFIDTTSYKILVSPTSGIIPFYFLSLLLYQLPIDLKGMHIILFQRKNVCPIVSSTATHHIKMLD